MKKHKMIRSVVTAILMNAMLLPALVLGQEANIDERIRQEATGKNSQIMNTLSMLTDVYGPRLTGSPNVKAAGEWAARQMTEWGLQNAALEPWDFGHPGWLNETAYGYINAPVKDNLVFEVLAWTPSTNGAVTGNAVKLELPDRPTQAELTAYLNSVKSKIKGSMIMIGEPNHIPVNFDPPNKRIDSDMLKKRLDPDAGPPEFRVRPNQNQPAPKPDALSFREIGEQIDAFLLENGAAVRINDAGREHGQIRAFNNRTFDVTKVVPTVVMRNEDYGRISRLLDKNMTVSLTFNIKNNSYPEGRTQYNTVAEIVGTDKKDEVIMMGGHLDSWHSATGATDNGTGCAIMMEAARILAALKVKPRRTIRVALWSGEEQGLLGSQAYVAQHFGSAEDPKPDYFKFGGYFNDDAGTGRVRGLSVFGPREAGTIMREIVGPWSFMGVEGAISTDSRRLGGSDHTSFNQAGLPGIGLMLDPVEYGSHTWHTNLDTYERVIPEDIQQAAMVVASAAYKLAMRDELLPRFSKDKMPELPNRR